jgi:lysophospholipase L1-like esterase
MRLRHLAATFTLLLVVCTATAAPAWSATAAGSVGTTVPAVSAFVEPAALLQRLDSGQSAVITLLGDSTGNEATEWFHTLSVWLAGRNPAHRTTYRMWSDVLQAYDTATVLGAGVAGGPTLTIYNGSVPGTKVAYATDATRFAKLTAHVSDLYVINYSHNEGAATTYPSYVTLTSALHAEHPAAGIVPVLQNPEHTSGTSGKTAQQVAAHEERIQIIRTLAGENRWPVIDAYSAFRADGRPLTVLVPDGVHPTAAGHAIWAAVAQRVFLDQSALGAWTDCPTGSPATGGYLCLWDNTNYDSGRWQQSYETLRTARAGGVTGCWNLTGSSYSSGLWAYDSASSWSLRKNPDSATRYQVQIFEWINCNTEGDHRSYVVGQDYAAADLRTIGWNNTAASVRVTIAP